MPTPGCGRRTRSTAPCCDHLTRSRADGAEPVESLEDRHQDDGHHEDERGVADRRPVADLVDVQERVGIPADQRAPDEGVGDPEHRPEERPGDGAAVDAGAGAEDQPPEQGRPGGDVVEADGGDELPSAGVDVADEDQVEDQAGDGDAQECVEPEDAPEPSVACGGDHQGGRGDQHEDVALDREVAQRLDHPGPDPDRGDGLAGVRIGSAGEDEPQLDDQGGSDVDDDQQVPETGRTAGPPRCRRRSGGGGGHGVCLGSSSSRVRSTRTLHEGRRAVRCRDTKVPAPERPD